MGAVKVLVRSFSLLVHIVLCLLILGISALALASRPSALELNMLPWSGATLGYILFFGSLFGLTSAILAIVGRWRILFLAWTVIVAVIMSRGFLFSSYRFTDFSFRNALYLMLAAWIAVVGAWFQLIARRTRKGSYRNY